MANIPFKNITSLVSTRQESQTFTTVNSSGLTYTLCDRTNLTSHEANYFVSFGLPYEYSQLQSGSTLSLQSPELQHLNVDKVVIIPIPRNNYNELIDGRTITFKVPQGIVGPLSSKTIVSSTYSQLEKKQNSPLLGNNVSFLFCDEINLPYTGTTSSQSISKSGSTTWNVTPYINRPSATAYSDLDNSGSDADINSDQRPFSGTNQAVQIGESYPTQFNQGYNYDIPVGFVSLDRGFLILTHPDIINNIPFVGGLNLHSNLSNAGAGSGTTDIYFVDTVNSTLSFNDIDIKFKTTVICLALPGEFIFSSNPSWNLAANLLEQSNGTNGYDPIQVTEIGLYNKLDELIAVAKLSEPLEKNFTNVINFNLDIDT